MGWPLHADFRNQGSVRRLNKERHDGQAIWHAMEKLKNIVYIWGILNDLLKKIKYGVKIIFKCIIEKSIMNV
jgi:hypothetical protein